MPVCPAGTRIKPAVADDEFWLTIGDALQQLEDLEFIASDVTQFLGSILNIVAPSRIDLVALCADEPAAVPAVDFVDLIVSGEWVRAVDFLGDWVFAAWKSNYWNSYCECVPGTGTGSCPPVAAFGVPMTANSFEFYKFNSTAGLPHGWTTATFTLNVVDNSIGGNFYVDIMIRDAANNQLASGAGHYLRTVTPGTPHTYMVPSTDLTGGSTVAHHVDMRAFPTGDAPQTGSGNYTFTPRMSVTFTGTCSGVPVTPPPPPLPPPLVLPPDTLPPLGPESCTIDTLCSMVYALANRVNAIYWNQSEHIAMDSNTNEYVHAHLPVVIPPPDGDGEPIIVVAPGITEYTKGEVFGPLIGESSAAIGDLVGVQVGVSQRPAGGRELEGQPAYLWNMGWLSILNVDGMLAERRITREGMVWLPREMPLATSLTWTLRDGVEIYLTELLPVGA